MGCVCFFLYENNINTTITIVNSNNISNYCLLIMANAFPPGLIVLSVFFWSIFFIASFFVDNLLLLLLLLKFRMISVYLFIFSEIYFFMKEKIKYKKNFFFKLEFSVFSCVTLKKLDNQVSLYNLNELFIVIKVN
ncbi:unnamed protein product [Schistosoma margrebowiei]|uniref:Uncharacterized protein n=1 Tax=Schistosoma margrebowiei TaxID=48269 RepID=A0A183LHI8_9TREM|nr:unnamed protein product [Schistosoma margrebowiei]